MGRRIFIGDIQGCRSELEQLLLEVRFDPASDVLHPVGDLVNRGPDSLGCLRLLRSLGASGVLGNHDLNLLEIGAGRRATRPTDTLDEILRAEDREELLDWLAERPLARVFEDVICVHAGVHPAWRATEDIPRALLGATGRAGIANGEHAAAAQFAISVRLCDREGVLPTPKQRADATRFQPWYAWLRPDTLSGRTIVYGHWAVQGFSRGPSRMGLDSGCVWGKSLSAWIPEEDRVVHVPAQRAYAKIR